VAHQQPASTVSHAALSARHPASNSQAALLSTGRGAVAAFALRLACLLTFTPSPSISTVDPQRPIFRLASPRLSSPLLSSPLLSSILLPSPPPLPVPTPSLDDGSLTRRSCLLAPPSPSPSPLNSLFLAASNRPVATNYFSSFVPHPNPSTGAHPTKPTRIILWWTAAPFRFAHCYFHLTYSTGRRLGFHQRPNIHDLRSGATLSNPTNLSAHPLNR
jgi:hypothetical protein